MEKIKASKIRPGGDAFLLDEAAERWICPELCKREVGDGEKKANKRTLVPWVPDWARSARAESVSMALLELSMLTLLERSCALAQGTVLVLGDIMLDRYLDGETERISPEAPVPVLAVRAERMLLGGAANVAKNIKDLGGAVRLVSLCGDDSGGQAVRALLKENEISADLLIMPERPTTVKTRVIAARQQMLRIDREMTEPIGRKASKRLLDRVAKYLPEVGAVILSDYGKGLVSAYLVSELQRLIGFASRSIPVLVDPTPSNKKYYAKTTLLTPNQKEIGALVKNPVSTLSEVCRAGKKLLKNLQNEHLLVTLGPDGMVVFCSAEEAWYIPTTARQVYDVTGAGDTVISALGLGLSAGLDLIESSLLANYAAGIVVGRVGAAAVSLEELQEALRRLPFKAPCCLLEKGCFRLPLGKDTA